jgi:hypothetical protein
MACFLLFMVARVELIATIASGPSRIRRHGLAAIKREEVMLNKKVFSGLVVLTLATAGAAAAQTAITLPDTSQTTTLTSNVSEQARVAVPANLTFNVTDVNSNKDASTTAAVSIDSIVLASDTEQLKVSVAAAAASFTPPVVGATTWSAGDVSWNASTWTGATGASGTLSNSAYHEIATCDANAASCGTSGSLLFTLAAKGTVKRSGNHTLNMTWKFESIGM